MSRKSHPVVSNLQTLLRQESDIADPSLLATHLLKKVEVATAVLPTTPALRGVALEALLTTFKFYFTHRHTLSSLEAPLTNGCTLLSSLMAHSPEGWGSLVLEWSVRVLACLSSLHSSTTSAQERAQYWMEQPLVKQLVGFVTAGVRQRLELSQQQQQWGEEEEEKDKGEEKKEDGGDGGGDCVRYLLAASGGAESNLSWLLAHIIAQQPSQLISLLLTQACSAPLTTITMATVAHTLELLATGHRDTIKQAMVNLISEVARNPEKEGAGEKLRLLLHVGLHSTQVLQLVAEDALRIMDARAVYLLACAEAERKMEGKSNVSGVGDSEGRLMEVDKPHPSLHHERSVVDNIVSLVMQLEGDEAVEALNTIMACVPLCTGGLDEGMEDGEISSAGIAQTQLLEGVQEVMSCLLQRLRSASSRLLLSSPQQHQEEKEEVIVVQFCVSLQPGLFAWAHKLASADTVDCIAGWLRELVSCVGMCGPELRAASVFSFLLCHCDMRKLPDVVSLLRELLLRHPGLTSSALNQAIATTMNNPPGTSSRLCPILLSLLQDTRTQALFCEETAQCLPSLLNLFPPSSSSSSSSSSSTLLDILLLVCDGFLSKSSLADCLSTSEQLLKLFIAQLKQSAHQLMNGGSVEWEQEEATHKLRKLLTLLCHSQHSVLLSVCSSLLRAVLCKDTSGYLMNLNKSTAQGQRLLAPHHHQPMVQLGEEGRVRELHSSSLQSRDLTTSTPENKQERETPLSQLAVSHSSMHLLWLANDVVTQGSTPSTTPLASALMDAVAPHCILPLQSWPEDLDTSGVAGRHLLELSLSVKRHLDQHPILWQFLSLISTDPKGFLLCGGLLVSVMMVMTSHWQRGRLGWASSSPAELHTSEQLITCLAKAGWLSRPLCYVGELFEHISCEEVFLLMNACHKFIKENYSCILEGGKCQAASMETLTLLKAILRKNIHTLSSYYCRFIST